MTQYKPNDYVGNEIYSAFNNSPTLNKKTLLERMYVRVLTELCVNRFKWIGLPPGIDVRFLEWTLFNSALAVFYRDEDYDRYFALRAAGVGPINMYDNPTSFTVLGNAMINKRLSARECVPIWSNYMRTPDWDIVRIYAAQLAEAQRTIEINTVGMRAPVVLAVPEGQRLTAANLYRQIIEGNPVINVNQSLNPEAMGEAIQALNLGIDKDAVLNMQTVKGRVWNECMTLLGIQNANQDKKERMVVEEVAANDGQVMASRAVAMNSRQMAAEQINEMFKLNVSVEWNLDTVTADDAGIVPEDGGF